MYQSNPILGPARDRLNFMDLRHVVVDVRNPSTGHH